MSIYILSDKGSLTGTIHRMTVPIKPIRIAKSWCCLTRGLGGATPYFTDIWMKHHKYNKAIMINESSSPKGLIGFTMLIHSLEIQTEKPHYKADWAV